LADISTKMSVSGLSQYKSAMSQAAQSVKTLDAQLKQNEAQYKASGDREKFMADRAKLLEDKLKAQKAAAKSASDALRQMKSQGVDPMSQAYQKMQQQLAQAETGVLETSAALNTLGQSEQEAAKGADQLTASVQGISKKISLDQVITGVNKITSGLENAAKKAVELGKAFAEMIMESAARGDNIATMASILGMDIGDYQRYQKVFDTVADITVQDWRRAQDKVRKAITSPSQDQINVFRLLGVTTDTLQDTGNGVLEPVKKNVEDVLWDVGMAIRRDVKSGKLSMLEADDMANAIFGKNWANLNPLFDNFTRDTFKAALNAQNVMDDESVKKLGELNDMIIKLKGDFESLQDEIMAGMAPALTKAAEVLDDLLGKLMDYMKTEQGQAMLDRLGEAVSGLFEDLANIDPESVVNNFVSVFDKLVSSFEWISNNWTDVETGLKAIVGVWAAGKATSGALTIVQMINGLKGLTGGGAGGAGEIALSLGGKLAFNGIEGTLGTKIGSAIATALTSTPMTVMIAAASIGALAHAIYTVVNEGDPLQKFLESNGMEGEKAAKVAEDMRKGYNPFDTEANARVTRGIKSFLQTGKWEAEPIPIPAEVEPETTAEDIAKDVGPVTIPVNLRVNMGGGAFAGGGGGGGLQDYFRDTLFGSFRPGFANGLPFVPWDGYIAMLHRGERVLTERENRQYTITNNTYFGGVALHNGLEVEALTDSIAARNEKVASGYGAN